MKKVALIVIGLILILLIAVLVFGPALVEKEQNVVLAHQPYKISKAANEMVGSTIGKTVANQK